MPYKVQFVGLVCFLRDNGGRKVFLPDGRNPGEGIEPHYGSIVVAPDAVREVTGWSNEEEVKRGIFSLDPCSISIQAADVPGTFDASLHDGLLPELRRIDPAFEIDPRTAQTIGRLDIRQGTLRAYRVPGGEAVISQLEVPYDGAIEIFVTPRDGSAKRTIHIEAGTEIAVTNMALGGYDSVVAENGHFRIYEKLCSRPVRLTEPPAVADVPPSPSRHLLFARARPIGLSTSCSNTGCCTP